ncbi:MAG: hypothetical protein EKK64_05760 [Neisseriaceae bacterium]|nr:MAG: hypothetical protein EKK64_05760 [Neisseriaceae bacterium]
MKYKCPHCSAQNSCSNNTNLYGDVQCNTCTKVFRLADADHSKGFFGHLKDIFDRSAINSGFKPYASCPYCATRIYYGFPRSNGTIALPAFCRSCTNALPGPYDETCVNHYPSGADPFPNKSHHYQEQAVTYENDCDCEDEECDCEDEECDCEDEECDYEEEECDYEEEQPEQPVVDEVPEQVEETPEPKPEQKLEKPSIPLEQVIQKCKLSYKKEKAKNGGKDLTEEQFMSLLDKIKHTY